MVVVKLGQLKLCLYRRIDHSKRKQNRTKALPIRSPCELDIVSSAKVYVLSQLLQRHECDGIMLVARE